MRGKHVGLILMVVSEHINYWKYFMRWSYEKVAGASNNVCLGVNGQEGYIMCGC